MFANHICYNLPIAVPRNFYSFYVGRSVVKFTEVPALETAIITEELTIDPLLSWTPQCQSYFGGGGRIRTSFVTFDSHRSHARRTMLVVWTRDAVHYDENQFIRQQFDLPWHGELIVCATSVHNIDRVVNLRGTVDLPDIRIAIDSFLREALEVDD